MGRNGLAQAQVESCPTGCPALGPNGCTIACGNERIACPAEDGKIRLAMMASDGTEDKAKG